MIVKNHEMGSFRLLFDLRGSIIPAIMPKIIFFALLGVVANLILSQDLFGRSTDEALYLELGVFTVLGVAISLFLGFHNNASYARWWEARQYWGGQVYAVRNLARFLVGTMHTDDTFNHGSSEENGPPRIERGATPESSTVSSTLGTEAGIDEQFEDIEANMNPKRTKQGLNINDPKTNSYSSWQAHIIYLAIAQTHAFRSQMRPYCIMDGSVQAAQDRDRFLNEKEKEVIYRSKNPANAILFMASKILGQAHRSKQIDSYSMIHTQKMIDKMCELQACCERIQNSSLPIAYSQLVHRTSILYTLFLPFAIAPAIGWWTPLFTSIVAYTFFGLDQLARDIQEPFRDAPMCLALSAMSRTVEINALEALGEDTRDFLQPNNKNCLM